MFDQGDFSEDSTFQLTDWLAHVPKEVLAKNFKVNITAFDHIPSRELYIFPSKTHHTCIRRFPEDIVLALHAVAFHENRNRYVCTLFDVSNQKRNQTAKEVGISYLLSIRRGIR